jgi:hypothetical protein
MRKIAKDMFYLRMPLDPNPWGVKKEGVLRIPTP